MKKRGRAPGEEPVAPPRVGRERREARGVKWDEARLPKLGPADGEDAFRPVDVIRAETAGLADPEPRDDEKTQQTAVRQGSKTAGCRQLLRRFQQSPDFFIRVEIRSATVRPKREEMYRGDFGPWVRRTAVACEPPHHTQSPRRPGCGS